MKKLIDTLNKADRESYTLRFNEYRKKMIDRLEIFPITIQMVYWCVYLAGFALIVIPLWKLAYPELMLNILSMFGNIAFVMSVALKFALVFDVILYLYLPVFIFGYQISKLRKEYFKVVPRRIHEK